MEKTPWGAYYSIATGWEPVLNDLTNNGGMTKTYPEESISCDRARIIRRSLRCFNCGLLGLIPIVGWGMAFLALRIHRQLCDETGERWNPKPVYFIWAFGLFFLWGYTLAMGLFGFTVTVASLLFLHQRAIRRQYVYESALVWNPARNHTYWGVGFGFIGCFYPAILLAALLAESFRSAFGL